MQSKFGSRMCKKKTLFFRQHNNFDDFYVLKEASFQF